MPQVVTPNLVEIVCQINASHGSGPDYNRFFIEWEPGSNAQTAAQDAITALTTFYNAIKAYYATGQTISVGAKAINHAAVPWQLTSVTPGSVSGTSVGSAMPAQCQAVVAWRTVLVGKSYRGRTFIGPLGNAAGNGNVLAAAFVSALGSAATALVAASASSVTWNLVVYSQLHNTTAAVSAAATSGAIRTLRSRA